nr:MAG TPA: Phosphoglucomutase/phosphomannomutase [Bacteriophage sp.]
MGDVWIVVVLSGTENSLQIRICRFEMHWHGLV